MLRDRENCDAPPPRTPRARLAYWLVVLACCAALAMISFFATLRFMPD